MTDENKITSMIPALIRRLIDMVSELENELCEKKWISVKDQMPMKDGRYLVHVLYNSQFNWIGISSLRDGEFDDQLATHWQLLPEAPE